MLLDITALRAYLKSATVHPISAEFAPQAEIVARLLPAMIDYLTDDELTAMFHAAEGLVFRTYGSSDPFLF
jgi:hypothetical protein